jgi:hypothetical protein
MKPGCGVRMTNRGAVHPPVQPDDLLDHYRPLYTGGTERRWVGGVDRGFQPGREVDVGRVRAVSGHIQQVRQGSSGVEYVAIRGDDPPQVVTP